MYAQTVDANLPFKTVLDVMELNHLLCDASSRFLHVVFSSAVLSNKINCTSYFCAMQELFSTFFWYAVEDLNPYLLIRSQWSYPLNEPRTSSNWSARLDSNQWPPGPRPGALNRLSYAPLIRETPQTYLSDPLTKLSFKTWWEVRRSHPRLDLFRVPLNYLS